MLEERVTVYLSYAVEIIHGVDDDGDLALLLNTSLHFPLSIAFKAEVEGKVAKQCKNVMQYLPHRVSLASGRGKNDERSMLYIMKESTHSLYAGHLGDSLYTIDGAPCHMHTSVCSLLCTRCMYMYVSAPNSTPYGQGCDEAQSHQAFGKTIQEFYTTWLADVLENLEDNQAVPPSEEVACNLTLRVSHTLRVVR